MTEPTEYTVRRATVDDVDLVAPLFDAYRVFYEYASDPALSRSYVNDRLARDESVVFVAEGPADAVGFTQLYPTFCSLDASRIFVLYDLFVAPAARRTGAASLLLTAAADFGRAEGASRLDLSTARTNTKAQALYESLGWQLDEIYLYYSLPLT